MLNQVSAEAQFSTTYVENYLECVEDLPDELQRLISRMRELDVIYLARVRDVQSQVKTWKALGPDHPKRQKLAARIQQGLIAAQELGDGKMHLIQSILEKIDVKRCTLDYNLKNLDIGKDEAVAEPKEQQPQPSNQSSQAAANLQSGERTAKRARRSRNDTSSGAETGQADSAPPEPQQRGGAGGGAAAAAAANNQKKQAAGGKKKKRKTRQAPAAQKEESPPREEEQAIDPDEPTYCLCDQISYGEMIMCDNDLCPIEWFHFSCVSLSTKPKGKWYCPKCRGDRPNVMKPKAQFLKELEKYNKEKEEKT